MGEGGRDGCGRKRGRKEDRQIDRQREREEGYIARKGGHQSHTYKRRTVTLKHFSTGRWSLWSTCVI